MGLFNNMKDAKRAMWLYEGHRCSACGEENLAKQKIILQYRYDEIGLSRSENERKAAAEKKAAEAAYQNAVKAAKNLKVKSPKAQAMNGRKAKITWKANKKASGYQIQYSTNKKFKKAKKTVNIKGAKKKTATIKKLQAGKTYFVRIRTFTNIKNTSGKTVKVYGKWVKLKKFKAKK